jgi:hypothetical protein
LKKRIFNSILSNIIMSKFPKGDRLNATYRHEFYQQNRTSPFVGYSKMIGHAEAKDKEHLLEQYISRMLKNGYLDRSYCMNFYTNDKLGNDRDVLLVSINTQGFVLHDRAQIYPHLRDLLTRFFANKDDPEKQFAIVSNRKRTGTQVESMYDFKQKFNDRDELAAHCKKVKEQFGESQHERLKGFYFKMIEINNL